MGTVSGPAGALCISFLASIQNVQGVHTQPSIYPDRTSLECVPITYGNIVGYIRLHFCWFIPKYV